MLGDLKRFLVCLSRRPERDQDDVVPVFYKWAMEISRGVEYLHSKKIVHRDLAARNILLTDELMCKVGKREQVYSPQLFEEQLLDGLTSQ